MYEMPSAYFTHMWGHCFSAYRTKIIFITLSRSYIYKFAIRIISIAIILREGFRHTILFYQKPFEVFYE